MQLPFSLDEFLDTFLAYSEAIGIAPVLLTGLAVGLVLLALTKSASRDRAIALGLALLWLWSGIVYHWAFFSRINPTAWLFGAVFVVQGILLFAFGAVGHRIRISPRRDLTSTAGWMLVAYALIGYPLAGWAQGHGYPNGPSFGAPCPTTIFFLGMMLWTTPRIPVTLVAIPLAWAAVGTSAAVQLGIREDFGLAVAAVLVIAVILRQRFVRPISSQSVVAPASRAQSRPA